MIGDLVESWFVPLKGDVQAVYKECEKHFAADKARWSDVVKWMAGEIVEACDTPESEERTKRIIVLSLSLISVHSIHANHSAQQHINSLAGEPSEAQ